MYFSKAAIFLSIFPSLLLRSVVSTSSVCDGNECTVEQLTGETVLATAKRSDDGSDFDVISSDFLVADDSCDLQFNYGCYCEWIPSEGNNGRYKCSGFSVYYEGFLPACTSHNNIDWLDVKVQSTNNINLKDTAKFDHIGNNADGECVYRLTYYCHCVKSEKPSIVPSVIPSLSISPSRLPSNIPSIIPSGLPSQEPSISQKPSLEACSVCTPQALKGNDYFASVGDWNWFFHNFLQDGGKIYVDEAHLSNSLTKCTWEEDLKLYNCYALWSYIEDAEGGCHWDSNKFYDYVQMKVIPTFDESLSNTGEVNWEGYHEDNGNCVYTLTCKIHEYKYF